VAIVSTIMQEEKMKIINVQIELIIDDEISNSREEIANYLNSKLYNDPEFFGDFGPENIIEVGEFQ
jgi:hypothetical protein